MAADALIMDLEDAVAPDPKEAARHQIAAALLERRYGQRELIVRTNSLYSPWGEDALKAVAGKGVLVVDGKLVENLHVENAH